jgi:hypothetical protein
VPSTARAKITGQAQGIPLFAVETIRSLIDRDIVQPIDGICRLLGDMGELAVPDSLHALLAARLDALDPSVRRLVADAAVLGTTFPADALITISGQDEPVVRAALADLVRREVLTISADPRSPERGNYGFTQNLLRQVAYDTLSRRDRKGRHLKVAAPGRWPPAPPMNCMTPPQLASCSQCSTTARLGAWPRCCGPSATLPAPASPLKTATRPSRKPSPLPSAPCAS